MPKEEREWWEGGPPNMVTLAEEKDMKQILQQATMRGFEGECQLVVFEAYSKGCHACRSLFPKLKQIAEQHSDVIFVKMDFDKQRALCTQLNIHALPMFLFYHGHAPVDRFNCNLSTVSRLRQKLKKHSMPDDHHVGAPLTTTDRGVFDRHIISSERRSVIVVE